MGNRAGESGAGGRRRRPGKEARMKEEIDRRRWRRRLGEEEESQEEIGGMVRGILSRRGRHQKLATWYQKKSYFLKNFLTCFICIDNNSLLNLN